MTGLIIFIVFFLLCCIASYFSAKERKRFQSEYRSFMEENEGLELFVYTNREKFCGFIEENLIPSIDDSVNIVKLEGKKPQTKLNERFISHALYRVKNVGFPNVMKIVSGEFIDASLHNEIYNAISNERHNEVCEKIQHALSKLRDHSENPA